ncbi:hypothetical protein BJY52DRAFT_1277942, partial [Lactarius psammicola]
MHSPRLFAHALPVDPPPPHPSHTDRGCIRCAVHRLSTIPHILTLPPSRCRPAASSSSRAPDHLRTGYNHPTCTSNALRMGYDNTARTPNSPSRKAMRRGTVCPPSPLASLMRDAPPPHPGKPTPACSHTRPFARMLWAQEGQGAVRARGAHGTRGGATRAVNGPWLHSQRRVLACAQRLEDARVGRCRAGR